MDFLGLGGRGGIGGRLCPLIGNCSMSVGVLVIRKAFFLIWFDGGGIGCWCWHLFFWVLFSKFGILRKIHDDFFCLLVFLYDGVYFASVNFR